MDVLKHFSSLSPVKQVIIYASAVRCEYYELLAKISPLIETHKRTQFLKAVDLWLA